MIVEIKKDIFLGNNFKGLNYLIQLLTYKQRYTVFVEITDIKNTSFYEKLDFDDKAEIEQSYNKIIQEGSDPKYLISKSKQQNSFDIEEAIRFFIQPVSIILENSLNDQFFLRAIIKYFDQNTIIQNHLDNGWIQFENAGGCTNVKNFIESKLQSFNNLSCQYNKSNYSYLRCFILIDSDNEYPNAPSKYNELLNFFEENRISSHILEKRCMENYMPDEVFNYIENVSELEDWIDAYMNLSEQQKDFLNINEGFSRKNENSQPKRLRTQLKQEIQNLYSDVSQQNYDVLNQGFKLPSFKTTFPKYFESHQVYKETLQSRCGTNELQEIIEKIAKLL